MDVICYDDLDAFGRDLDDPLTELEQDIVHLLLESIGSNCDAPDRSIGLDDALSGQPDLSLKHRIEQKLMDDPRILAARAIFTTISDDKIQIELQIQVDQTQLGITVVVDAAGNLVR
jgi:hypothetical protein